MAEINPKRAKRKNSSGALLAALYTMCTFAVFVFIGLVIFHMATRREPADLTADSRQTVSGGQQQGDQNAGMPDDGSGQISVQTQTAAQVQTQAAEETQAPARAQTQDAEETQTWSRTRAAAEAHARRQALNEAQASAEAPAQTQTLTEAPVQSVVSGLFKDGSADPDGYILPQSESRELTDADLSNLTLKGICYAKNEIYARYGRKFQAAELQEYFDRQTWYSGTVEAGGEYDQGIVDSMNEYENINKDFLSDAEEKLGGYSFGS